MEEEIEYIVSFDDSGNKLNGDKNYEFHLPPDIPASSFWSIIVYDNQTRLMIHTDQKWPSVFSNSQTLVINQDRSVDVRFGPKAPIENNCNFIQTIPERGWIMILRLYGPTEAWFDKRWRPGEMEKVI